MRGIGKINKLLKFQTTTPKTRSAYKYSTQALNFEDVFNNTNSNLTKSENLFNFENNQISVRAAALVSVNKHDEAEELITKCLEDRKLKFDSQKSQIPLHYLLVNIYQKRGLFFTFIYLICIIITKYSYCLFIYKKKNLISIIIVARV